ncbi:hypothetical protein ACPV5T_04710 [Vibrio astriarenae]|uniref:hypothetical protein n=1 Tax=Vibrio rhodolitus TaxID=2231649 RepID=UPI000E0AA17C|nr:hypothetical protein [Vibrio rhodolitus]
MEFLTQALENPVVGAVGYVFSFVAACIAIHQAFAKTAAKKEVIKLKQDNIVLSNENYELQVKLKQTLNNNSVSQGDKSQYFQENSGPVNIDMRG